MFWNNYPYTDFHELNLDWIIAKIMKVEKTVKEFEVFNKLTWAGVHDPLKEYEKWSIVQTITGDGYLAVEAVPSGVTIDNEDYWVQIANYDALYTAFNSRITANEDAIADISPRLTSAESSITDLTSDVDKFKTLITTFEEHGAVGDGVTDDTDAIQEAINSAYIVLAENSTYKISSTIDVPSNVTVDLEGATITLSAAIPATIFNVTGSHDVTIKNGKIVGVWLAGYEANHFMINLYSSKNVLIESMELFNNKSDGIYIGYPYGSNVTTFETENIVVRNCYLHHIGRNGIVICSGINVDIDNVLFKDIKDNNPKACIDVEPETGVSRSNLKLDAINIHNCIFKGEENAVATNIDMTLVALLGEINIYDCTVDNGMQIRYFNNTSDKPIINVHDITFLYASAAYRIYIKNPPKTGSININDIIDNGTSTPSSAGYGLITIEKTAGYTNLGGVSISNVQAPANNLYDVAVIAPDGLDKLAINIDASAIIDKYAVNVGNPTNSVIYSNNTGSNPGTYYDIRRSTFRNVILGQWVSGQQLLVNDNMQGLHKVRYLIPSGSNNLKVILPNKHFADNSQQQTISAKNFDYLVDGDTVYIIQ